MDLFEAVDLSEVIPIIVLGTVENAKEPRISQSTGQPGSDYLQELLSSSEKRIYKVLQMKKDTFYKLCLWLRRNSTLKDSRFILIEEQVAMFLWTINYSASTRVVAERF